MRKMLEKAVCKFGTQLCALAVMAAPLASGLCKTMFYQPVEPDGLRKFAQDAKRGE